MGACYRLQPVDEGIAGNQGFSGDDVSCIGPDGDLAGSTGNRPGAGVLMKPYSGNRGRPRQPDQIFERIDVARARVMGAAVITRRAEGCGKLLAIEKPQALVSVLLRHDLHVIAVIGNIARLVRGRDLARTVIGVNAVRFSEGEKMRLGPLRHGKLCFGVGRAEIRRAFLHPGALSGAQLAAIAA